jgi:hypothetical protein
MSARSLVTLSDGRVVRGYRKTLRRNPAAKPVVFVRAPLPPAPILPRDPPSAEYPVRLTFLLPVMVLVSPGPHGFNTAVLPGNVVRIRGRAAEHCFELARCFFAAVARERVFTSRAVIARDDDERTYGRHLTVVRGALVISGGLRVPKVYEGVRRGVAHPTYSPKNSPRSSRPHRSSFIALPSASMAASS